MNKRLEELRDDSAEAYDDYQLNERVESAYKAGFDKALAEIKGVSE